MTTAVWTGVCVAIASAGLALGQTTAPADLPPKEWIDPDTGHRVHRLSDEPNSGPLYFNYNAFTNDGRDMVYSSPAGIHLMNLATRQSRLLVPKPVRAVQVGHKTRTFFYVKPDEANALYAIDLDTNQSRKLADMPRRGRVDTINADETLAAGTYIEGDGKDYGDDAVKPQGLNGPMVQPLNKAEMMRQRLDAKLPMVLFTIDLKSGQVNKLLHSTDWLNHLLFSPTDPNLLMYCHEGPWTKVDRIWTIRSDGTANTLVHQRTMAGEIAGHEFWGLDGKTIWYDLQQPKGETFILAAFTPVTGQRRYYRLTRDQWSIHFNINADETVACGDGGDKGQVARAEDGKWIYLFKPQLDTISGINGPAMIQPGVLRAERLVNMSKHNYKAEPNVRLSPDGKTVIFQSNAWGPSYLFGVDVEKASPDTHPAE